MMDIYILGLEWLFQFLIYFWWNFLTAIFMQYIFIPKNYWTTRMLLYVLYDFLEMKFDYLVWWLTVGWSRISTPSREQCPIVYSTPNPANNSPYFSLRWCSCSSLSSVWFFWPQVLLWKMLCILFVSCPAQKCSSSFKYSHLVGFPFICFSMGSL